VTDPLGRPRWPSRPSGLAYGGDYSPEQWDEDTWREDVELMAVAGVNLVNLGVFAWATIEPSRGRYDFSVMDKVMDLLDASGIGVDLATPTASPPAWLAHEHPDMLPMTADGHVLGLGARESFCPSSPHYRDAAAAIADALARRYGSHPALVLWHVHNEYGAHVGPCYCPASEAAFRGWLQARYGSLDELNSAWGTSFWGQRYSDWQQVSPPRRAPMPTNPAQQLDFMRFTTDEYLACYRNERDVLRAATPDIPITTNFMATSCKHMDYWRWAAEVDVVANDHYLTAEADRNHIDLSMAADLTRSLARGKPWLLMEHSTSAVNWQPRNIAKLPGELRRNSLTHVARGADGAMFFQWRASRFGAEKFHSAMLPHAGTSSQVWREVAQLGADLQRLREVRGSRVSADVALIWAWPSWWALELEYRPSVDVSYLDRMRAFYTALWEAGVTVDFVDVSSDLAGYGLVVAPSLYLLSVEDARKLDSYVSGGGTLLVSYFSGIVDESDQVHPGAYPGALRDVLGVSIEEFHPLRRGEGVRLSDDAAADVWSERIVLSSAQSRATFIDGPDAGSAAITRNARGEGRAWYVGTRLDPHGLSALVSEVLADAGVSARAQSSRDVEVVRRVGPTGSFLFVINHEPSEAIVAARGVELLSGQQVDDKLVVPASGVAVVKEVIDP
jgi:beta-galactosidase